MIKTHHAIEELRYYGNSDMVTCQLICVIFLNKKYSVPTYSLL